MKSILNLVKWLVLFLHKKHKSIKTQKHKKATQLIVNERKQRAKLKINFQVTSNSQAKKLTDSTIIRAELYDEGLDIVPRSFFTEFMKTKWKKQKKKNLWNLYQYYKSVSKVSMSVVILNFNSNYDQIHSATLYSLLKVRLSLFTNKQQSSSIAMKGKGKEVVELPPLNSKKFIHELDIIQQ